jgi:hypothetical protein
MMADVRHLALRLGAIVLLVAQNLGLRTPKHDPWSYASQTLPWLSWLCWYFAVHIPSTNLWVGRFLNLHTHTHTHTRAS